MTRLRIFIIRKHFPGGSDLVQRMFELLRQTVRRELAAITTHFSSRRLFEEICEIDFRKISTVEKDWPLSAILCRSDSVK